MIAKSRHAAALAATRRSMCASPSTARSRLTSNRPDKKNPLTFESYAEIANIFRAAAQGQGREGLRRHGRRRQFLLRRRRVRDHRPAGRDGHGRPARIHAHDRRAVKAMRALPAADRRRDRRHLRRRGRDPRDGLRHAARHARRRRSRSCSTASALPAATWARARSCRASSARAAPSELLYTGRTMGGEEARALGLLQSPRARPRRVLGRGARSSPASSPTARRSPTP